MMQLPRLLLPYPGTTTSSTQAPVPVALYQPSSVLPIIHHPIPAQFSALPMAPTDADEKTYGQLLREQEEKEQLTLQQTQVEQRHKQEIDLHRHRLRQEKLIAKQQQQQQRQRARSLQKKQNKKKKQKNSDGREETTTPLSATQPVLTHIAGPAWSSLVQQMNGSNSSCTSDSHTEQGQKQKLWSKPQRTLAHTRTKHRSRRHTMMDNDDDDDSNHTDTPTQTENASFSETESLASQLLHTDRQQQPEEKQAQDEAISTEQLPTTTMLTALDTDSDDVQGDVSIVVSSGGVEADESSGVSERQSVYSGDDRAAVLPLPDTMVVDDDYPVVHGNHHASHTWSHPSANTGALHSAHHRRRVHQRHPVAQQDEPPAVRQVWSALPVVQTENEAAPQQPSSIWSQPVRRSNHGRDQIPIVADTSWSSSCLPLLHMSPPLLSTQHRLTLLHPLPVHPPMHRSIQQRPRFRPLQSNQTSIPYHDSDTEEESIVSTIDIDNLVPAPPSSPPSKPPVYFTEDSAAVGMRMIDIPCVSEKWNKLWQMSEAWIQGEQSKEIAQAAKEMTKQVEQQQQQDTTPTNTHTAHISSSAPVSAVASAPAGSTAAAPTSVAPLTTASAGLPPTTAVASGMPAPTPGRLVDAAPSTLSEKPPSRPDLLQQAREANQVAAQLKQSIKEREDTQMHKQAQSMLPSSSSAEHTSQATPIHIASRPGVPPTVIGTRSHTLLYIDPLAMLQRQQQPSTNKPSMVPSVSVDSSSLEERKERQQWMQDRLKQLEQQLGFPVPKPTVLEVTSDKLSKPVSATTTPATSASTTAASTTTTTAAVTSSTVLTPSMAVMSEVPFQRLQQDMQVLDQELAQLEAMSRRIQQSLNPTATTISAQETTSTSQSAPPQQQQPQLQQEEEAHAQSIVSRLHAEVEKTKTSAATAAPVVVTSSSGTGSSGNNMKTRTLTFADLMQENQLLQKKSGANNRGVGITARGFKSRASDIPTHTLHRALTPVPIPPIAVTSSSSAAVHSPSVSRRLSGLQNSKNSTKSSSSSSITSTPRRVSKSRTTTAAAAPVNEDVLFAQAQALIEQFRNEFNTALSESSAIQLQSIRA